jgi:hypothetical protein
MNIQFVKKILNQFQGTFVDNDDIINSKFGWDIFNALELDVKDYNQEIKKDIMDVWTNPNTRFDCTTFRLHLRWLILSNKETWNEISAIPNVEFTIYPFKYTALKSINELPTNKVVEAYWICEEASKKIDQKNINEEPATHTIYVPGMGWIFLDRSGIHIGTVDDIKNSIMNFCKMCNIWEDHYQIEPRLDEVVIWH